MHFVELLIFILIPHSLQSYVRTIITNIHIFLSLFYSFLFMAVDVSPTLEGESEYLRCQEYIFMTWENPVHVPNQILCDTRTKLLKLKKLTNRIPEYIWTVW